MVCVSDADCSGHGICVLSESITSNSGDGMFPTSIGLCQCDDGWSGNDLVHQFDTCQIDETPFEALALATVGIYALVLIRCGLALVQSRPWTGANRDLFVRTKLIFYFTQTIASMCVIAECILFYHQQQYAFVTRFIRVFEFSMRLPSIVLLLQMWLMTIPRGHLAPTSAFRRANAGIGTTSHAYAIAIFCFIQVFVVGGVDLVSIDLASLAFDMSLISAAVWTCLIGPAMLWINVELITHLSELIAASAVSAKSLAGPRSKMVRVFWLNLLATVFCVFCFLAAVAWPISNGVYNFYLPVTMCNGLIILASTFVFTFSGVRSERSETRQSGVTPLRRGATIMGTLKAKELASTIASKYRRRTGSQTDEHAGSSPFGSPLMRARSSIGAAAAGMSPLRTAATTITVKSLRNMESLTIGSAADGMTNMTTTTTRTTMTAQQPIMRAKTHLARSRFDDDDDELGPDEYFADEYEPDSISHNNNNPNNDDGVVNNANDFITHPRRHSSLIAGGGYVRRKSSATTTMMLPNNGIFVRQTPNGRNIYMRRNTNTLTNGATISAQATTPSYKPLTSGSVCPAIGDRNTDSPRGVLPPPSPNTPHASIGALSPPPLPITSSSTPPSASHTPPAVSTSQPPWSQLIHGGGSSMLSGSPNRFGRKLSSSHATSMDHPPLRRSTSIPNNDARQRGDEDALPGMIHDRRVSSSESPPNHQTNESNMVKTVHE